MRHRLSKTISAMLLSLVSSALLTNCDKTRPPEAARTAPQPLTVAQLEQAANAGDATAQLSLGQRYEKGEGGVSKDIDQARAWYAKAADSGNLDAMMRIIHLPLADMHEYKRWLKKAADAGNAEAQCLLALTMVITSNEGLQLWDEDQDEDKLIKEYLALLDKSVAQNYPRAQYQLGMSYLLGISGAKGGADDAPPELKLKPDSEKALKLLTASATSGYWEGQKTLAIVYQEGLGGIAANPKSAEQWWARLKETRKPDDQYFLGWSYYSSNAARYVNGTNKYDGEKLSFDETNKIALAWFEKSDAQGNVDATYTLAGMADKGLGMPQSDQTWMQYLKKAAEHQHPSAELELGQAYQNGKGVLKDYVQAREWMNKAVTQRENKQVQSRAQFALGGFNEEGMGGDQDKVIAYAWFNLAAASGVEGGKEGLARVEPQLSRSEVSEAQALSRNWQPGTLLSRTSKQTSADGKDGAAGLDAPGDGKIKARSSGTGFAVSLSGNILTNNHVVKDCGEIRLPATGKTAKFVVADEANDLAVIKLEGGVKSAATIYQPDDLKQGEQVVVFGYPLEGYLPSTGNITQGIVSALAGPNNNTSIIQITAPIQPGSSGGPVLNLKGQVVGVVVGKANAMGIAKIIGDIPQNVNFAVAGRTVKSFLDGNRIEYQKGAGYFSFTKSVAGLADEARDYSVKIECWK